MRLFGLVVSVLVASPVIAQVVDDTDLSRYQIVEEGEELATLTSLEALENEYHRVLIEDGCKDALPLIVQFSEESNKTANILRQSLEPFYDANRDDQQRISNSRGMFEQLVQAEGTANNLIEKRNIAWVDEAQCLIEAGDAEGGVTRLYRALDLISWKEGPLWEKARNLLWAQINFIPK